MKYSQYLTNAAAALKTEVLKTKVLKTKQIVAFAAAVLSGVMLTTTSTVAADGFQRTGSEGSLFFYEGQAVVSGKLEISSPNDYMTPCRMCFYVDDESAAVIPRENDPRSAWFTFENTKYREADSSISLGGYMFDLDKCYLPMQATVKIKDYTRDIAETETVDETTLVSFINIDEPVLTECDDEEW